MSSGFGATLDRGGLQSSHMISSLSTPTTATSSGTNVPARLQASSRRKPRTSLQVMIPTGLGRLLTHFAICPISRSQRGIFGPRQGVSYSEVETPAWCTAEQNPPNRRLDVPPELDTSSMYNR